MLQTLKYRGWRVLEDSPNGPRVTVRLRFDAEEEAAQFALSFGANLKVVSSLALRERVLAAARRIPAVYRERQAVSYAICI